MARLAVGLRDDSRIKIRLADQKVDTKTYLLAGILDRLSVLIWMRTTDGEKGRNKPEMITDVLTGKNDEKKTQGFNSPEEFEYEYRKFVERR